MRSFVGFHNSSDVMMMMILCLIIFLFVCIACLQVLLCPYMIRSFYVLKLETLPSLMSGDLSD